LEIPRSYQYLIASARPIKWAINLVLAGILIYIAILTWHFGNRTYSAWSARPFEVTGPFAINREQHPGCVDTGYEVEGAAKLTLVAPGAVREGKLQIKVQIGVTSGSRWSIYDVQRVGAGKVRMDRPDSEYWVYDVSPGEEVSFLICGVTSTPAGGSLLDDLRLKFSDSSWL